VLLLVALILAGCAALMADTIEELIKKGLDALTAGRYDEAISKFLEVVQRDPKHWQGYLYLTRAYIGKSSWTDAIASGRRALELAPSSTDVVSALAQAFFGAGSDALGKRQFSEAAGYFGEFVKLRPTDWQGYLQLGRSWLGTGSYSDALLSIVQGLGHATDGAARQQLVQTLLDGGSQALASGNAGAAINLLREYVRQDSGNVAAWVNLGKAYWQSGQLGSALSAYQKVLELNPSNTEALQFIRGQR
jgi:cytochrome c-type biogenesis protein CcmH/NrfG